MAGNSEGKAEVLSRKRHVSGGRTKQSYSVIAPSKILLDNLSLKEIQCGSRTLKYAIVVAVAAVRT